MPGMGSNGYSVDNPLVTALFSHSVYVSCVMWIVALGALTMLVAVLSRRALSFNLSSAGLSEPRNRTYLRLAFGAIWLFYGILQFQVAMPLGLPKDVVTPAMAGTPGWLHSLMLQGIYIWDKHPIALADGTAWIQVGIGLLLIVSNAKVGRVAAVVSVGWAALIWLVGNGAGGIFLPGNSIVFGWPGATLFYVIAGVWLALDPRHFPVTFSKVTLRILSVVFALGIVGQALPSTGAWRGGNANSLTAMSQSMTQTPQPHWLAGIVRHVGVLAGTLGGGYNLIILMWLATVAVGLWMSSRRGWRWPVWVGVAGCLYFWVTVQDTALFGGLATDVNSLLPLAVLIWAASPSHVAAPALARRLPREFRSSTGAVVASFAGAMVVFSVVSMALASVSPAETTLYVAQNGGATSVSAPASGFSLIDQSGAPYRLGEHPGRYTLLTFLDPVCWTDCPLIAEQFAQISRQESGHNLDLVAVAANPLHESLADVQHFVKIHSLGAVKNFHFVTGATATLKGIWDRYGIGVTPSKTSVMSIHADLTFIIDPRGRIRWVIPDDPGDSAQLQGPAVSEIVNLLQRAGYR